MVLCDIRDAQPLTQIFRRRRPDVVFHAAALKHLPMLEQYPAEAVKTNVIGTRNVLDAARAAGVRRFVNISTDKAANPESVLGYSKRVAERITATYAEDARRLGLRLRALRERAGQPRIGADRVRRPDRPRRPGDGDASAMSPATS